MSFFSWVKAALEQPTFTMVVRAAERVGSHMQLVSLELAGDGRWNVPPGSYIQVHIGGVVPRAYSVVDADEHSGSLLVSFSRHGVGARFFETVQPGTVIEVRGPFTDFAYTKGGTRPKVFVATGSGIAPFKRMVAAALQEGLRCTLVFGVPTPADLAFADYFDKLAADNLSFTFMPVISRPTPEWRRAVGHVTDVLWENPEQVAESDLYVCGIQPMVDETRRIIRRFHMPREQIFIESFG